MTGQCAYYFGCLGDLGHYFHEPRGRRHCFTSDLPAGIPWTIGHMDGGLLKNGEHRDVYDGKVFWTCGGRDRLWYAFVWWDNSVDGRGASNSGFYVEGFGSGDAKQAFDFACVAWPMVIARQKHPLVLQ